MSLTVKKYLDWRTWLLGLYVKSIEAFATTFLTLVGTNIAEQAGITHVGLTWRGALVQFGIHVGAAAAMYVKAKPLPDEVVETPSPDPA